MVKNAIHLIWFFVLSLLVIECSSSKSIKTSSMSDSILKKYSYLIVGYKGEQIHPVGTGFFYKFNEGYKFITTRHSVTEINTFNKQIVPNHYDFLGIVYKDTILKTSAFLRLDIRPIKSALPTYFFYESPDVIVFDLIGLNQNIKIYSINDLLPQQINADKKFENVIIWGYGYTEALPANSHIDSVVPKRYEGKIATAAQIDPYYPQRPQLYTVIQPESMSGMSGSPVFFKYTIGDKNAPKEIYEFAGLQFGSSYSYKTGYIHTYEAVMGEIYKETPIKYTF